MLVVISHFISLSFMFILQIVVNQKSQLQSGSRLADEKIDNVATSVHTKDRNTIAWASPGKSFSGTCINAYYHHS